MVGATPAPETLKKSFAAFLIRFHSSDLRSIILSPDQTLHYPLIVHFAEILNFDPELAHLLFSHPADFLPLFDEAVHRSQRVVFQEWKDMKDGASEKAYIHVRINISGSPLECPETFPSIGRLRVKHRGMLLTLRGTVIRSGTVKMIEGEREYQCKKCKGRFKVYPEIETGNKINLPSSCPSRGSKSCVGVSFQCIEDSMICHDYQEIKIQESAQLLGVGSIPRSIPVVLMDDLVDLVKAGDDVIITGVLTAKWSSDLKDVRCDLDPIIVANFVRRTNELKSETEIPDDIIKEFEQFWSHYRSNPLKGRNAILQGICPQIFGLFTVKLAVALTMIGGVQHVDASGTKVRGEPHMLLVGDPGTGKSQLLKFAAKLSNRSVITTGLGSTSAGLTVTAVKDSGEWMLEAGALVLADGGLCCIDEFDSMREHDRATIHEAMEQQTISVAKAGLVTTLSTRTTVFGATNPKGQYDPNQCILFLIQNIQKHIIAHKISEGLRVFQKLNSSLHLSESFSKNRRKAKHQICYINNYFQQDWFLSVVPLDEISALSVNTTLSGPLLSRFDIVLVLLDTKNPEWDAIVSSHILAEKSKDKQEKKDDSDNMWSLPMLRRYIHYVKQHFRPVLTKESEQIISSYYQLQRRSATDNAARTTVRMLESLIRLAQAHARLMFRNEVTQLDAIAAILCVESSMTISAIVDSDGNALHSNFTDNPDQEYAKQEKLILEKLGLIEGFP